MVDKLDGLGINFVEVCNVEVSESVEATFSKLNFWIIG